MFANCRKSRNNNKQQEKRSKKWWKIDELPELDEHKEHKLMHTAWKKDWWQIYTIPDDPQTSKKILLQQKQKIGDAIDILREDIRAKKVYQKYINGLQDDLSNDLNELKMHKNLKPETYISFGKYIILSAIAILVFGNSLLTTLVNYVRQTDEEDLNTELEDRNLGFSLTFIFLLATFGCIAIFSDLLMLCFNNYSTRNKSLGEQQFKLMQRLPTIRHELARKEYIISQIEEMIFEEIKKSVLWESDIDKMKIKKYIAKTLDQTDGMASYEKILAAAIKPKEIAKVSNKNKGKEKDDESEEEEKVNNSSARTE